MWRILMGVFVFLGLGACSNLPLVSSTQVPCPATGFLADTDQLVTLEADQKTVLYKTTFGSIKGLCRYEDGFFQMDIDLEINMAYTKNRENTQYKDQEISFFISAMDNDLNILNKQSYVAKVTFDNTGVVSVNKNILFGIRSQNRAQLDNFKILVGFQLSKAQLGYNREKGRL